ncbi:MAG: hypothetical protein GWN16_00060, partial [Calditrichae bacterium]|nr:hypothetical protein [Calditrichia bacterium]
LDTLLSAIVKNSLKIAKESEGKFDFTLWPVFRLWHFGTDSAAIPDSGKIDSALQHVDYQNVKIDTLSGERENLTQLHVPSGVELDFGGISKGFALEMARKELTKHGLRNFIIDAGGNLAIEWSKPDSVQIYVRHPRMEGEFWGQFPVYQSCGIATSGDYHFYFLEDGKRYHHILDPQTGYPVEKTASCSIVAPTSTLADGYSTAVFVMGMERGSQFIESRSELEGLMIYPGNDSLQTYLSSGLQNRFKRMEVGE